MDTAYTVGKYTARFQIEGKLLGLTDEHGWKKAQGRERNNQVTGLRKGTPP